MTSEEYARRAEAMGPRLYRVAQGILWRRADCADAVQEAVFRGWLKRSSLREERYFETWLIRILINECRTVLRRRRREPLPLMEAPAEADSLCEDIQLRIALGQLPEKYRLPLILHYVEGYPLADIAAMLGIPEKLVKSRLHQARKALAGRLEGGEA